MNTVLGSSEVVVIHWLLSSDTILTFWDDILTVAIQKQEWVIKAFSLEAKLYESKYLVIVKGLPASILYSTVDSLILEEIKTTILEVIYYKLERYWDPTIRFMIYIIYI